MEHRKDLPPKVREFLESVGDEREAMIDPPTGPFPGSAAWFEQEVLDLEQKVATAREESPRWYLEGLERQLAATKENLEYMKKKEQEEDQQQGKGRKRKTRKVRKTRRGKKKGTRKQ